MGRKKPIIPDHITKSLTLFILPYKNNPKHKTKDAIIILNIAGSLILLEKQMLIKGKKLIILAMLIIPNTIQIDIPDKNNK